MMRRVVVDFPAEYELASLGVSGNEWTVALREPRSRYLQARVGKSPQDAAEACAKAMREGQARRGEGPRGEPQGQVNLDGLDL